MRPPPWAILAGLGILGLVTPGCAPHSPARVATLAARGPHDARAVRRLVRALGSPDPEVARAAWDALRDMGPEALPLLQAEVERGSRAAGRLLMLLGEFGDPDLLPWIQAYEGHPDLGPFAAEAMRTAETRMADRLLGGQADLPQCDAYLTWFPGGPHADEVRRLRRELEARQALEGARLTGDLHLLETIARRYGDTRAGQRARDDLADAALGRARRALDEGRPRDALAGVQEALSWRPDAEVAELEAAARASIARDLAAARRLDEAIRELAATPVASPSTRELLAHLHLQRAEARFQARDPVGALQDLRAALDIDPSRAEVVRERVDAVTAALLDGLEAGTAPAEETIRALLVVEDRVWPRLRAVVEERLAAGDPGPLVALASQAVDDPRIDRMVRRAWSDLDGRVQLLLADRARVERLLDPATAWEEEASEEVLALLQACEGAAAAAAVRAAWREEPLPDDRQLLDEAALAALAERGATPLDPQLPRLHAAGLLRFALARAGTFAELAETAPGALAAQLVGRTRIPSDLVAWAAVVDPLARRGVGAPPYRVALSDGSAGDLQAAWEGPVLVVAIVLDRWPATGAEGLLPDVLTVLFGAARPLAAAHPGLQKLEVRAGPPDRPAAIRLAMDRRGIERTDWSVLEAEAPFGPQHLSLVLDQSVDPGI